MSNAAPRLARSPLTAAGASLLLASSLACGGSQAKANEPAVVVADAGGDAAGAVVERPFASTPLEAQTMIQALIDARMKGLWKCVEGFRTRTGDPHRAVTVTVGIDQEGHLFGVNAADPKHPDLEPVLKACLLDTLRDALFPRSHAGVITVKQGFQDTAVQ